MSEGKPVRRRAITNAHNYFIQDIESDPELQYFLREGRTVFLKRRIYTNVYTTAITALIPPVNYELFGIIDGRLHVRRPCGFLTTYVKQDGPEIYKYQEVRDIFVESGLSSDLTISSEMMNVPREVKATINIKQGRNPFDLTPR